jgi:hypothetical protein
MTRPRGYLTNYNPQAKTRELLSQVEDVLITYQTDLPLTGRQIFYRLVGTVDYPKDEKGYGRLMENLGNFRRAGKVAFDVIRDDGATELNPLEFASPDEIFAMAEELAAQGQGVRLEGQECWPELWCEAAGMAPQLARVVHEFGVTVYSSGGFDSLTVKYAAARRIVERDVPTVILHVGDFDPSGVTLFQAALEDVGAFAEADGGEVEFKRIAVTPEQIDRYDLPGSPPKNSTHAAAWRTDADAVQAEAMAPSDLAAEIRQSVIAELDMDALEEAKSGEAGNREEFDQMMRRMRGEES